MNAVFYMFGVPISIILWGGAIAMISSLTGGFLAVWNTRNIQKND